MTGGTRTLELAAPAKLNLFLHVVGRRADGYHELQTLFRLVDLCDVVSVSVADATEHSVVLAPDSDGPRTGNLIERAARAVMTALVEQSPDAADGASHKHSAPKAAARARVDRPPFAVTVSVRKHIPQGGLGGGSSDAAAVLLGLNHLLGSPLSIDELAGLGRALGADVPVFVRGDNAWAEGIGEQLSPLEMAEAHYVIVAPGVEVPTATVFAHPSLTRHTPLIRMRGSLETGVRNDCEALVRRLYPEVDRALHWLSRRVPLGSPGEVSPRLTGTGGCVFAEVGERARAEAIAAAVPAPWRGYAVRGIARSFVHTQLGL